MTVNSSPERYSFQAESAKKKLIEDPANEDAAYEIERSVELRKMAATLSDNPEWQKDNLEYDLRSTAWIIEKVKADEVYAQHLYAALCNQDFTKNEMWPLLLEKKWSCSWRHAGGIIADMLETGDYIDWYCSGLTGEAISEDEFNALDIERQALYLNTRAFVSEGIVTDEIRKDLFDLGWTIVPD